MTNWKKIDSLKDIRVNNKTRKARKVIPIIKWTNINNVQTCGFGPNKPFKVDELSLSLITYRRNWGDQKWLLLSGISKNTWPSTILLYTHNGVYLNN